MEPLWSRRVKDIIEPNAIAAALGADAPIIDIHAHTFNGSDLSVQGFLADVLIDADEAVALSLVEAFVRMLAGVLGRAPDAEEEIRRLDEIASAEMGFHRAALDAAIVAERDSRDAEFMLRLEAELTRLSTSIDDRDQELFREILKEAQLEPLTAAMESGGIGRIAQAILQFPGQIGRYIRWVKRLRNFRYEIINELIDTYGNPGTGVTLFTPSMVDFARWLKDEPITPPSIQVVLASRLTTAFPGRVHFFAPYDPWREADNANTTTGSFYWAQRAVYDHGCIGIKLYPPMGFAATGNPELDFHLVTSEDSRGFGTRVDAALDRLYTWAEAEEVPIIAHCNKSQGSKQGFELRASPEYWAHVLARYPQLRLNLGHFGGQNNLGVAGEWPELIIALIGAYDHVYADIGMFNMADAARRTHWFISLLQAAHDQPRLKARLLYGSDWMMLAKEDGANDFLSNFASELRQRFTTDEAKDILGRNAARYLGLRAGKNHERLIAFYKVNRLPNPDWLA